MRTKEITNILNDELVSKALFFILTALTGIILSLGMIDFFKPTPEEETIIYLVGIGAAFIFCNIIDLLASIAKSVLRTNSKKSLH